MSAHDRARDRAAGLGLRHSGTGSCPRRLVGLPHREGCWCTSRLNDHSGRYLTRDGTPVVVWEPYDADGVALAAIIAAAAGDGLDITVTGASAWYPGATFAVVFTRPCDLGQSRP